MKKHLPTKLIMTLLAFLMINPLSAQTWEEIETPVTTNLILYDISFPAGQNDVGFTGGSNVTYNGKGKVLKTDDAGETWTVVWESETNGTGIMSIYFESTMIGYAGTMSGDLMKTIDGGVNWTSTDIDPDNNQGDILDIEFFDSENAAMMTSWEGVYISSDGGDTWDQAATNYYGHDLCYADETTLFACGGNQNIYKSTDGGDTWTFSYQGANSVNQWYNLGVYFYDSDNGIVTSEEGETFITNDGGDSWTLSTIPGQNGLMNGAWMIDEDNIYVCATPGEVFLSTDGGTSWDSDSDYNFNPSYYKVKFTDDGTGFVCGSGASGGTILKKLPGIISIEEIQISDFTAYPNPASDQLNLKFQSMQEGVYKVCLIDAIGKRIIEKETQVYLTTNSTEIDLSEIPNGNYIISIEMDGESIVSKKLQILH